MLYLKTYIIKMEVPWNQMNDNFSLSYPYTNPDLSDYYVDHLLYEENENDYSVDTSLYYSLYSDERHDGFPDHDDLLEKFGSERRNISQIPIGFEFDNDDASWVMACTFLIFTMHTGYGLIESGLCGQKNQVNILMRNVLDVVLSGFVFWCVGYSIVFGNHPTFSTPFFGIGGYFYSPDVSLKGTGENYLRLFYQITFATSTTTIASAAMAERANMKAFMLYGLLHVFVYSFPANWLWGKLGWLRQMGVVDLAGAGAVHELGGFCGLVVAKFIKPRIGINHGRRRVVLGNAKNGMMGMFMMWWGFLAFNSSSTFGVTKTRWMYAAKATVTTMLSSFGGGTVGLISCYIFFGAKINVSYVCNSVFGALVAITAGSFLVHAWEAVIVGLVSGSIVVFTMLFMERTQIDDPRGVFAVHGLCGCWGLISIGIFGRKGDEGLLKYDGILHGGYYLLMVQSLAALIIAVWGVITTYILLWLIDRIIPLRTPLVNELLGADYSEHNILHSGIGVDKAIHLLREYHDITEGIQPSGNNLGHSMYLENNYGDDRDQNYLLDRTRLSLASLFRSGEINNEDIIKYSKTMSVKISSNPRLSEGGGLFGSRRFFGQCDPTHLYRETNQNESV